MIALNITINQFYDPTKILENVLGIKCSNNVSIDNKVTKLHARYLRFRKITGWWVQKSFYVALDYPAKFIYIFSMKYLQIVVLEKKWKKSRNDELISAWELISGSRFLDNRLNDLTNFLMIVSLQIFKLKIYENLFTNTFKRRGSSSPFRNKDNTEFT